VRTKYHFHDKSTVFILSLTFLCKKTVVYMLMSLFARAAQMFITHVDLFCYHVSVNVVYTCILDICVM